MYFSQPDKTIDMTPTLSATPDEALIDEELTIRLEGLNPSDRTTLVAEFEALWGAFRGEATFEADETGVINLTDQAPIDGDYDGVRPMGLVQFAQLIERAEDDDPTAIADSHWLQLRAERDGERIAETTVVRRALDPDVERITVEEEHDELVGDFYLPSGDGPHPGVVSLGGSNGGVPTGPQPKLLASHGYAVLALAYFQPQYSSESERDDEHLPEELVEVPLEYAKTAVNWFRTHDRVQSEPVGTIGGSRGSELALLLGARLDPVRTVVGYVPSGVVFEGISFKRNRGPAWTENGESIPYIPYRFTWRRYFSSVLWHVLRAEPLAFEGMYRGGLADADPDAVTDATIPVEDIGGPVLSVAAGDDAMWPSDDLGAIAIDRLAEREYDHFHDHVVYEDAGHGILVPYLPARTREAIPIFPRFSFALGGQPDGYAEADSDSWQRVLDTLERGLG